MNILLLLYILAAVGSFAELIAFRIFVKRPRPEFVLFFMACLIANLGYLALAFSRNLPEAVLANKLTYLGGIFLPFFMLQTIAEFCNTKLPKLLTKLLFIYSCVVFVLVCTIGYSQIYYRQMALGEFLKVRYLWKTYGPAHILFPILLYTEIALAVVIVLRSIRKQKNVALRTTVMLLWGLVFSILAYVIERTFGLPVELVGFSYVIFAFFHIDIAARMQIYDIDYNIEEVFGHSQSNGYISFNSSFCLMNYNSLAADYFNELKKLQRGSNKYEDSSGINRYIINWLRSLDAQAEFPVCTTFDHNDRNFRCSANRLNGIGKKTYGYMVEIVDDTASRQYIRLLNNYNKTLEESVETAEKADRAKSRFLANMSHEIRTPINVILGMNEMTLREAKDENIIEYSNNIRTAGRTLLALINSILDFSKIEDGKMDIVTVDYDTAGLINELIIMAQERADEKGLTLQSEISGELPSKLHGDDVRVRQIITNLLTNAIKYTSEGRVTLRISVREAAEKSVRLLVEVEDTGIGIRDEDRGRLFASFERLEEEKNRNIEGTGLGISIVQRLLEMMGSELKVDSTYGKGSRFYFELEQGIADAAPMGLLDKREGIAADQENDRFIYAPEAEVLLVDDNRMNLMVAKGLLKRNGVRLTLAESGIKALELAEKHSFDIIFLDHLMPELGGIETLKRLRSGGLLKEDTKVIMMTANAILGARELYLKEGFDGYLSKPVNVDDLETALAKFLPESMISYKTKEEQEKEKSSESRDDADAIPPAFKGGQSDSAGNGDILFIDREKGLQYAKGDEDFYNEMVDLYVELKEERVEALNTALENRDIKSYVIASHDLKSNSRLIGAENFAELAWKMESAGKQEDIDYIEAHHSELMSTYDKIIEVLSKM
ncbi:MAG: response regulator [Lachnospiraceae bacterium]|nr:response regulator [Lachnospiraceae bacterium]